LILIELILLHSIVLDLHWCAVRVATDGFGLFRCCAGKSLDAAVAVATSVHGRELWDDGGTSRLVHLV